MKTLEQLKAEAKERGIVEGAVIGCAADKAVGTVANENKWRDSWSGSGSLIVGDDDKGACLYAKHEGKWATVLTPAPSKEDGLKEGDACECGPAMRAAIMELGKELGVPHSDDGSFADGLRWEETGLVMTCDFDKWFQRNGRHLNRHTPEAFITKMRVTAKLPKPEPPIMIKVGEGVNTKWHEVKYQTGSIKVGYTTIDNATVRAIAAKLIDQ